MPASFPTSIKSFTTKVDNVDYIAAAHVNDIQLEVVAIETALGASLANIDGGRTYLYGLTLANGTDATNDINIATGVCSSDDSAVTDRVLMSQTGNPLVKRLDAAWAVGSGNGGLDTGEIANTTYHIFVIKRIDTGVVDALFSVSASAPTMPANYTKKRRVGSILRESAAIVAFNQKGNYFFRKVPIQEFSTSDFGTSAVVRTLSVPLGIIPIWIGSAYNINSGSAEDVYLWDTDLTDTAAGAAATTLVSNTALAGACQVQIRADGSAHIYSRHSVGNASTTFALNTHGWIDTRGV